MKTIDDDPDPEIPPIVEYAFLPKQFYQDSENDETEVDKFLSQYALENKLPGNFGSNIKELNEEIKSKIYGFYLNKNLSENNNKSLIPISHLVSFPEGDKTAINTLDIDRSGNLLVTGNRNGIVKIWDFNSLTRKPKPNHVVDYGGEANFPVLSVSWSPSGGFCLVVTGDCQAKVINRDGGEEIGCLKGDNYIVDVKNTKGHTYGLKDGKWHPFEKNIFITSSIDSTIRLWDIYSKQMGIETNISQKSIFKPRTIKNKKIPINCCNFSNDGKLIIGGVNDGSIQIFSPKLFLPQIYIPNAHQNLSEITSILFAENNINFYSRATDDTMKLWDIRKYSKPIHTWNNLICNYQKTDMCLSPNEDMILTGTNIERKRNGNQDDFGEIKCFSTKDYKLLDTYKVSKSSVISLKWKDKINQIAVGTFDGNCHVFFDLEQSNKGIISSIFKKPKIFKEKEDIFKAPAPIITPMQLPLFDEVEFTRETYLEKIGNKDKENNQLIVKKGKEPESCTISQHIVKALGSEIYYDEDPQEALGKFRNKEGENGIWIDNAYKKTQPKPVLDANPQIEEEVLFYEQAKKHRCPKCGLKFCTCNKNIFQIPIEKLSYKKNKP